MPAARLRYFASSVSQSSKTETPLGSMEVNLIPIPAPGREWATLPSAAKRVPSCEIRSLTFVPLANGFVVSTKQPKRLKFSMCAAI